MNTFPVCGSRSLKKNWLSGLAGFQNSMVPCCTFQALVVSTVRTAYPSAVSSRMISASSSGPGIRSTKFRPESHDVSAALVPRDCAHVADVSKEVVLWTKGDLLALEGHASGRQFWLKGSAAAEGSCGQAAC